MSREKLTELGQKIRDIRERFSLSQLEFARRLGITDSYVSQLEAGKKKEISDQLAKLIAYEFKEDVDWRLTGEGPKYSLQIGVEGVAESSKPYQTTSDKIDAIIRDMSEKDRLVVLEFAEFLKKKKEG